MKRFSVAISRYGGLSLGHAASLRALRERQVPIVEMVGCAYPEMALGEFCRQAREAIDEGLEAIVLVDPRATFGPGLVEEIANRAIAEDAIVSVSLGRNAELGHEPLYRLSGAWTRLRPKAHEPCSFAAIPTALVRRVTERVADLGVGYFNTPFAEALTEPAREQFWPLFTPFEKGRASIVPGMRVSPESAFCLRALRYGERVLSHDPAGLLSELPPPRCSWTVRNPDASRDHFPVTMATFGPLDHQQQRMLNELDKAGVPILMLHDYPLIDVARDVLLETALGAGFAGAFMLDHDIHFVPQSVLDVVAQAREMGAVVGVPYCMRRTGQNLIGAFEVDVGSEVTFFEGGGLYPAHYAGMGFTAIPRRMAEEATERHALERLETGVPSAPFLSVGSRDVVAPPLFSLLVQNGHYAGEDVSFCARVHDIEAAEQPGGGWRMRSSWQGGPSPSGRIFHDTRHRIFHVGSYRYGIEDMGIAVPRLQSLRTTHAPNKAAAQATILDASQLRPATRLAALGLADEQTGTEAEHPIFREPTPRASRERFSHERE